MKKLIALSIFAVIVTISFAASTNTLEVGFTGSIGPSPCDITANTDITVPNIAFDGLADTETFVTYNSEPIMVNITCTDNTSAPTVLIYFTHAQDIVQDSFGNYLPDSSNINPLRIQDLPILGADGTLKGLVNFYSLTFNNYVENGNLTNNGSDSRMLFDSVGKDYIVGSVNPLTDKRIALRVMSMPYSQSFEIRYHIDKNLIDASEATALTASFNATITYL